MRSHIHCVSLCVCLCTTPNDDLIWFLLFFPSVCRYIDIPYCCCVAFIFSMRERRKKTSIYALSNIWQKRNAKRSETKKKKELNGRRPLIGVSIHKIPHNCRLKCACVCVAQMSSTLTLSFATFVSIGHKSQSNFEQFQLCHYRVCVLVVVAVFAVVVVVVTALFGCEYLRAHN